MSVLTDHELEMVVSAARASGPKDDATLERIITWAERASPDAELFRLVTEGALMIDWDPSSEQVRFKLTSAATRGRADA